MSAIISQQPDKENKVRQIAALILQWSLRIGLILLGLLLVLMLIFLLPPVQNWAVQKVSNTLTEKLETDVKVGSLRITFFDRLTLKKFFVADLHKGDTLLYSENLKVNFVTNPFVLIRRGLTIEEISLTGATFNIRKAPKAKETNLETILGRLFHAKPTDEKEKGSFRLDIRRLNLKDVAFLKDDKVRGQRLYAALDEGKIVFRRLNIPDKKMDIRSVVLNQPIFQIDEFEGTPIALETVVELTDTSSFKDTTYFKIDIETFQMRDGSFSLHNYFRAPVKLTPDDELDYQHMDVSAINMDIRCFSFKQDTYLGEIKKMAFKEQSGFVLNELSAREAKVSPTTTELIDFKLKTPFSEIGDTLILRHRELPDYKIFPDAVNMQGNFHKTSIAVRDIMAFAPGLKSNAFFSSNQDEVVLLDGEMRGRVNNLRGRDLDIRLSDGSRLQGSFSSRNLAVKNEEFLNLRLEELVTRMKTLRQLIPGMNLPDNFDRLGRLNFQGSFDGFFADFVAYGDLRTDIGRAIIDMRMNLKNGRGRANYSGKLKLENFDLSKWTNSSDFGLVNFSSEVKNGVGLTAKTASAQLTAEIQSFYFKNYNYQNAKLAGQLNRNLFDGTFSIQDENIDFNFRGLLNYQDSIPVFDFQANVNKIDLRKLNLLEKDLVLAGNADINLRNDRLSKIEGDIDLNNIKINHNQIDTFLINSVSAKSVFTSNGNKEFLLKSDVLDMLISGLFDIEQIPDLITTYFSRNYPVLSNRFGIKSKNKILNPSDYTYDIQIKDTKGLSKILDERLSNIQNVSITGFYNSSNDSLLVKTDIASFTFGNIKIEDVAFNFNSLRDQGLLDLQVNNTIINQKLHLDPITFVSFLNRDTLDFGLNYYSGGFLDNLNLEGKFYPLDTTFFQIQFEQSNLVILEMPWEINANNFITFGKDYIEAKNFTLKSQEKKIVLETTQKKGLKLQLFDVNFDFIDELWDYDPLNFGGDFNVMAEVGNIFEMTNLQANITSDSFFINNDPYGKLQLIAKAENLKTFLTGDLLISDGISSISAKGKYNLAEIAGENNSDSADEGAANYFDFDIDIKSYPLCIAEYFIGDVISNSDGRFDGKLKLNGLPKLPNINGNLSFWDGAITVNYLKTTYTFAKGNVDVNNFMFNAGGITLYDKYGHTAIVSGGIRHDHLRNFSLDARLRTSRFLALDTQKGDNKLFYGHALGQGDVRFNGPFNKIDIYINATAGDSTRIVIPISSGKEASELKFVNFVDKRKEKAEAEEERNLTNLTGVSLEMNLNIQDEADIELVFNEQTGDIIKGSGRGNLRVLTPRNGDFQMFGDYVIQKGDYLFTLYNVVNKKFAVRPGGYIQWTGDPFGAQINIEAEYKGLNTSVANFIQEYLVNTNAQIKNDASKSTQVVLVMRLKGELLRPLINFDILFPALNGQLKAYTDSKMNLLRRDQNELNRQVFGLIVVGQFLPENVALQGSEILYNTVSEFVSNQLSLLLTELFSEVLADGRVLSGIDFDIAY
ncbi:MAG: translocation/assembly module TamB domain-containing protein, partial [Saprospiraceae bacterium]|nr:translocation/assembly module TamB domain-containing protein [Saprospiraceae bacterium]